MRTGGPALFFAAILVCCGCGTAPRAAPCFTIQGGGTELRAKDAQKRLADLEKNIHLSTEDEALRTPTSIEDIRKILRRDVVYAFAAAAAYARSLNTLEGRFGEASLELFLGESQLVASQILSTQAAWVGGHLRIARANLASEGGEPTTDRGRMLFQLIRAVEEGNEIADALGAVAPAHLTRGAEVIRQLKVEAPTDVRTFILVAEYHRLRGEWSEFEVAMKAAEEKNPASPPLRYLRAMEQLERFRRADLARKALRECIKEFPRFVRPQVALVLMANNSNDALRQLGKLRRMSEDHYLLMLLEPTLAADEELKRMQGDTSGGASDAER